jgi:hypothetical protein
MRYLAKLLTRFSRKKSHVRIQYQSNWGRYVDLKQESAAAQEDAEATPTTK